MDPATLMAIASAAGPLLEKALGGAKDGEFGSTYNKTQRRGIEDVFKMINQMRSGADITQSPSYQQGNEWLMSMFNDPEFFNSFEAPLQRQFQEQTVPDLANRFASMGSGGSLGSTAFRNQLAREGSNLSTNIASLRGGMQQNAIPQLLGYSQQPFNNLLNLYQTGLGHPTNNQYQQPSAGFFGPVLSNILGSLASGYGQQAGQNLAVQKFPGQSPSTI